MTLNERWLQFSRHDQPRKAAGRAAKKGARRARKARRTRRRNTVKARGANTSQKGGTAIDVGYGGQGLPNLRFVWHAHNQC